MIKYHNILLTEKKKLLDSQIGSMIFRKMIYNMYNNVNNNHLQGNFHIFQLSFLNILIQKCLIRGKVNIYTYIYIYIYIYSFFQSSQRHICPLKEGVFQQGTLEKYNRAE